MHASLTRDKDRSFPLPVTFGNSPSHANDRTGRVADTSENGLVEHHDSAGEFGVAETEGRCTCFADDYIAWFEERAECLFLLAMRS